MKRGGITEREYSQYVRRLDVTVENSPFMDYGDMLVEKYRYFDGFYCCTVDLKAATDYMCDDIRNNDGCKVVKINGYPGISGMFY